MCVSVCPCVCIFVLSFMCAEAVEIEQRIVRTKDKKIDILLRGGVCERELYTFISPCVFVWVSFPT